MNTRTRNFSQRAVLSAFVLLALACSERPVDSDCGQACELFAMLPGVGECREGHCTPTIFECFDKTEFDTCSAMCESVGSACAEKACAGVTYLIHTNVEECLVPSNEGARFDYPCDEPIDWQVNTGAQCCCEQP
jgi:hypothetical protein